MNNKGYSRLIFSLILLILFAGCSQTDQGAEPPVEKATTTVTDVKQESQKKWVSAWKETSSMLEVRSGSAVIEVNGVIHMIGGVGGKNFEFTTSTEYARIQEDGTLSAWQKGNALNVERGFIGAAVKGNYVYVVGGGRGPNGSILLDSVERAEINPDGTLGTGTLEEGRLNTERRCTRIIALNNNLYAFGGFGGILLDTVEQVEVNEDGSLGEWLVLSDQMNEARYIHGVESAGEMLYAIGGHDKAKGLGITGVEWSREDDEGLLQPWAKTAPLKEGRYGLATAQYGDYLYALGGLSGAAYLDTSEKARLNPEGGVASWESTTKLPATREGFNAIVVGDKIYILGGTSLGGFTNQVYYAGFNEQGDIGYLTTAAQAAVIEQEMAAKAAQQKILPNEATVVRHIKTEGYSYLGVKRDDGLTAWLAGPASDFVEGSRVQFPDGVVMRNFFSKELKQNFPAVMFVGEIRVVGGKTVKVESPH
ncbi:MAG: hypothetical protein L3J28_00490 [Candidatus Polarisedimenticolaceae bacterium]|nr:hypothetical protein [Candidatus Polarisedimenticolaceae bacterium]